MDLETENRIAAILLKEAAELRCQAEKEGALAYLRRPAVRNRPNSRFLKATVRGVQQANRVVEVNEMWRLREKQLELDNRLNGARRRESSSSRNSRMEACESRRCKSTDSNEMETSGRDHHSSKKRSIHDLDPTDDEGLRDDEVEEFLHSRTKRGRGAVGSRMDETGPYLPCSPDSKRNPRENDGEDSKRNPRENDGEDSKRSRVILGPEKPNSLKYSESSSDDESIKDRKRKAKIGSSKRHSRKHKSKDKSTDKKKEKRKEKKTKYH